MKKQVWVSVGIVFACAFGFSYSTPGMASAATDSHGGKSSGWAIMFTEKYSRKYYNGVTRIEGRIAQVCPSADGHHCKRGGKQRHARHGVWKWYWTNGQIKAERHFQLGHLHGTSTAWYPNGQKRWVEHYNHGKLQGTRTEWFNTGKKKSVALYENGRLHGIMKTWWWNGTKASVGTYDKGKRVGLWNSWYSNGQLKSTTHYKEGDRHGKEIVFWYICRPSGCDSVKMQEGFWKKGKKDGTWTYRSLDTKGNISSRTETH